MYFPATTVCIYKPYELSLFNFCMPADQSISFNRSCIVMIDHVRFLSIIFDHSHPCFVPSVRCTILALHHPCSAPSLLSPSLCCTILALHQPCFVVSLLCTILASTGLRETQHVVFVCYAIAPCIMMLSIYGGSARNRLTDQQTSSRPANQQTST